MPGSAAAWRHGTPDDRACCHHRATGGSHHVASFCSSCRDGTGALTQQELLLALPALQLTAAAARLLLRQATRASLHHEAAQPAAQQRWQLLASVVQSAFAAADPRDTGVLRPGEQVGSGGGSAMQSCGEATAGAARRCCCR